MRLNRQTKFQEFMDAFELLGFEPIELDFFRRIEFVDDNTQIMIYAELLENDTVTVTYYIDAIEQDRKCFASALEFIDYIESLLNSNGLSSVKLVPLDSSITVKGQPIVAKSTSRDFASKLQRVKSSNVWSYAFNPKDEYIGDMLVQFKGTNGGPGDIYIYYDVPTKIWRGFVAAPSKGHYFWQYIRNVYTYAKLTGDKKTKLKHGI